MQVSPDARWYFKALMRRGASDHRNEKLVTSAENLHEMLTSNESQIFGLSDLLFNGSTCTPRAIQDYKRRSAFFVRNLGSNTNVQKIENADDQVANHLKPPWATGNHLRGILATFAKKLNEEVMHC